MNRDKPNVLLITSDQQHWNTLGITNKEISTPNLDKLAEAGTIFDRAYCVNPTCTPTRASVITGQYPSQHGAWSLGTKLPEECHVVGEDFNQAGYRTALVGKAHFQQTATSEEYPSLEAMGILQDLDFWRCFDGPFYGFEHVELARNHVDEPLVGQHYAIWMEENGCADWRSHFRKPTGTSEPQQWTWSLPEQYHYDRWIAERTNALIEQYKERGENFFLWASFFDPHPPYLVPEPWDRMYDPDKLTIPPCVESEHVKMPPHFQETQKSADAADFSAYDEPDGNRLHGMHSHVVTEAQLRRDIAIYYGMISLMDKHIGSILDRLDELGMVENTIVVFSTDHGHFFGQHGLTAKGPFHYEDMIKVPFLVRWPGRVPARRTSSALQSLVDLAPTFLSLCGISVPRCMTGVDQSAAWLNENASARNHVVVENHQNPTTVHLKTFVDDRWKITVYFNRKYGELFDLENDGNEIDNLWDSPDHQSIKLQLLLRFFHAELGKEPVWMPRVSSA